MQEVRTNYGCQATLNGSRCIHEELEELTP